MKYLIRLGIQGLKRVLENRGFTEKKIQESRKGIERIRDFEQSNFVVVTGRPESRE